MEPNRDGTLNVRYGVHMDRLERAAGSQGVAK